MPIPSVLAVLLIAAVTVALEPEAIVPPVGERLSHDDVFDTVQVMGAVPALEIV